ncbi:MAG: hypothetical protein JO132_16840 [Streptosporangiaceae bacterium]|nr:hypothetical protein [Streptosporangiaceae bacterium]
MAAPAYWHGGLIVVTFDEGSNAAACCGETRARQPEHARARRTGPGGGRIGTVLVSC